MANLPIVNAAPRLAQRQPRTPTYDDSSVLVMRRCLTSEPVVSPEHPVAHEQGRYTEGPTSVSFCRGTPKLVVGRRFEEHLVEFTR